MVILGSRFSDARNQFLVTAVANVLVLGQGCSVGWVSPNLPYLQSDQTPLGGGPLSITESSWLVSCLALGAMLGTLTFGWLTKYIGGKNATLWCVIPITLTWILIRFSVKSWQLILARFLSGLTGGGLFICLPLFVPEIASDNVRGALGSMMTINFNGGILLGYIGGTYLSYESAPMYALIFPAIFLAIFSFMPSSPQYLLKINKIAEAEKSLKFYRNVKNGSKECIDRVEKEFEKLKAIAQANEAAESFQISDFFEPAAVRGLLTGLGLVFIVQLIGIFTIINYAATIFKESGSLFDPKLSGIIMGCMQLIGTICALSIIDKVGRRILMLVSTSGCAIGLSILGTYSYLNKNGYDVSAFNWVPVITLSFVILIAAIGVTPMPYVLMAEILPQKIRRIGSVICIIAISFGAFVMFQLLPIIILHLHLYGLMWIFSIGSVIGIFFSIFVIKETKGKNLDTLTENK